METCSDRCEESKINTVVINKIREEMPCENEVVKLAETFKVLGDPTRIRIIFALSKHEMCVCDIAESIGMSQSAISHQLRVLRNLKLVKYRKEGKSVIYSLDDGHILSLFNEGMEHVRHS